jgi:hypothetical protein
MNTSPGKPTPAAPTRRIWEALAAAGLLGLLGGALWHAHALDQAEGTAGTAGTAGAELRIVGLAPGAAGRELEVQLANHGREALLWNNYPEGPDLTVHHDGGGLTQGTASSLIAVTGPADFWRLEPGEVIDLPVRFLEYVGGRITCRVEVHRPSGESAVVTSRTIDLDAPRAALQARLAPTPGAPHRHSGGIPRWRSPAPWWRFWD